jgi:hypothetical protein
MRRLLIPTAAAVVLVANVWGLVQASRNRAEARGGRLELSEQELRLEPAALESTAILLDLQWRTRRDEPDNPVAPGWLDTRKLTELGFDCRMPVDNPSAKDHYRSMAARPAYMVLELAAVATTNGPQASKRLVVVDAGPEPAALRARHPDANRFAIAHGVVGLVYLDRNYRQNDTQPIPRLEGRIETLLPSEVFVPPPYSQLLAGCRRETPNPGDRQTTGPRFKATVCWGANYEPWIADLRLTEPTRPGP